MKATNSTLAPELVASVIEHMNSDHAEACLLIVKAFTDLDKAINATLIDLDKESLLFQVTIREKTLDNPAIQSLAQPDREQQCRSSENRIQARIKFAKALTDESQIRSLLIRMTRQARQQIQSGETHTQPSEQA